MKHLYLACLFTLLCAANSYAQELKDSFEVYFQLDKDILLDASKKTIDSMFSATDGRRLKLRVTGHTCKLGTDDHNLGLSERRAKSAFEYVKSKGEATDKIELFFYGEQNPKYTELEPNRRVFVLTYLEDDDRDTLLKQNCLEVFVEKGTYKPTKNKDITFSIKHFKSAGDFSSNNLSIVDDKGRKLLFSTAMFYSANLQGKELTGLKNVKVKMPIAKAPKAEMMLYRGEKGADGKIMWVNTGKPCGPVEKNAGCETLNFDWNANGFCACAMPRLCQEDCHPDPFGGEEAPDRNAADIRHSPETVVKFPSGVYPKELSALSVEVKDDKKFEYDLDLCGYFKAGVTTMDVFPAYRNVKASKNIIVEAKDGGNLAKSDANKTFTFYLPKSSVKEAKPVLVPGANNAKGYIKWDIAKFEPIDCRGSVNCEYYVFEVPAYGNYKLAEWQEATNTPKPNKYILKTRVLKNSVVFVGEKLKDFPVTPLVYKAKNHQKKGKNRPKEYDILECENPGNVVLLVQNTNPKNQKKVWNEAKLSELKFKSSKNMYIMRKKDFKKVDDFKNMNLSKCK